MQKMLKNNLLSLVLFLSVAGCTSKSDITIISRPFLVEEKVQSDDLFGGSDTYLIVSKDWKVLWSNDFPKLTNMLYEFIIVPKPEWKDFGYLDSGNTIPPGYLKEVRRKKEVIWKNPNLTRYSD